MDLSKLPKLSNTQSQEPSPPAQTETGVSPSVSPSRFPVEYRTPSINDPNLGADIWVNSIIGLLMIGMGFTFAQFLFAKLTGHTFHTQVNWTDGPKTGQEVAYFELEGFTAWTQMGMFLFGLVLLLEAAAKAIAVLRPGSLGRSLLIVTLVLTAATTALNLFICLKLFGSGTIPMISGLGVAFGGWILASEWQMLKSIRPQLRA